MTFFRYYDAVTGLHRLKRRWIWALTSFTAGLLAGLALAAIA